MEHHQNGSKQAEKKFAEHFRKEDERLEEAAKSAEEAGKKEEAERIRKEREVLEKTYKEMNKILKNAAGEYSDESLFKNYLDRYATDIETELQITKEAFATLREHFKDSETTQDIGDLVTKGEKVADELNTAVTKGVDKAEEDRQWTRNVTMGAAVLSGVFLLTSTVIGGVIAKALQDKGEKVEPKDIDMMLEYVNAVKLALSEGKITQEQVLTHIAEICQDYSIEIEDQITALIVLQSVTANLEETEAFFWVSPSDTEGFLDILHSAYQKNKQFADLYTTAKDFRYQNSPIPLFHNSILLQLTLMKINRELHAAPTMGLASTATLFASASTSPLPLDVSNDSDGHSMSTATPGNSQG